MPGTPRLNDIFPGRRDCYLLFFFFSCLAAFFSFMVLAGFFLSLFFESKPLLMSLSAVWLGGTQRVTRSEV
jgi:hypothetical protein